MSNFSIKIADLPVGISCTHPHLSDVCSEYLTDEAPLFSVGADEEHKEELRKFFLGSSQVFSDAFLESVAVQEKVCAAVLDYDAAVFHAALISFDGQGIAFAAPSGTGKTTQYRLWKLLFGDEIQMLCGDKPVIEIEHGGTTVFPSPWRGKENMGNRITAPLGGIIILEQEKENSIRRLLPREAAGRIYLQFMFSRKTKEQLLAVCSLEHRLLSTVPVWLLKNRGDEASAMLCRETIEKELYADEI